LGRLVRGGIPAEGQRGGLSTGENKIKQKKKKNSPEEGEMTPKRGYFSKVTSRVK